MGLKLLRVCSLELDTCVPNKFFEEKIQVDGDWIIKRTGIKNRYYTDMSASEMAVSAVHKLNLTEDESDKIRAVIVTSVTPDLIIPSMAAMVQKKFNISNNCMCFDLNTACSGHAAAVIVAEGLLHAGEKALIVSAEKLSDIINYEDKKSCLLFGDGAAAALYQKTESDFVSINRTYGNDEDLHLLTGGLLEMHGRNIFRFALDKVPEAIRDMLDSADLSLSDMDHVVMHQANMRIIQTVSDMLGINDKVSSNVENYGNTSSASIPILMAEMSLEGKIKSGQKILILGFGGGLTIHAAVIES